MDEFIENDAKKEKNEIEEISKIENGEEIENAKKAKKKQKKKKQKKSKKDKHKLSNGNEIKIDDEQETIVNGKELKIPAREKWEGKWQFFSSCLGITVGLGNIWRFPYLVYKHGGAAFLIPYLIMILFSGQPLYFLDLYLGQYSGKSCVTVWSCAPIAKGIGIVILIIGFCSLSYYNMILSYALYYLSVSMSFELPWSTCEYKLARNSSCLDRSIAKKFNMTVMTPSEAYWIKHVLNSTDSLSDLGGMKWDLFFTLVLTWVILGSCVIQGIRSIGKIIHYLIIFPYVCLTIFVIYGAFQPGASIGIFYMIFPSWEKLLNIEIWKTAAGQMFYSLGLGFGKVLTYSSFNDFHHDIFRDTRYITMLDTLTSVMATFMVFCQLGKLSLEFDIEISEIIDSSLGLGFIVFPEALSFLPMSQFWSFIFFFMLFMFGLTSAFGILENILTSISDVYPWLRLKRKELCISVCLACLILGIPYATRGGIYILKVMDEFVGAGILIIVSIAECIVIYWIYGIKNANRDIELMLGFSLNLYWKLTWGILCPLILLFLLLYSFATMKLLSYDPHYPVWSDSIVLFLIIVTFLQIPIWAFLEVRAQKTEKWKEKFKMALRPTKEWGPNNQVVKEYLSSPNTNLST